MFLAVYFCVAILTDGQAIIYGKPQLRKFSLRFNMMGVQISTAAVKADLAGEIVSLVDMMPPIAVFGGFSDPHHACLP